MPETIKELLFLVKDQVKFLPLISSIASSLLLFTNETLLVNICLDNFKQKFSEEIGLLWLLSLTILIIQLLISFFYRPIKKILKTNNIKTYLKKLTIQEKQILCEYIYGHERTREFPIQDGVIVNLERKGIIYRASTTSYGLLLFPYNISDWVYAFLLKHKQYIENGVPKNIDGKPLPYRSRVPKHMY